MDPQQPEHEVYGADIPYADDEMAAADEIAAAGDPSSSSPKPENIEDMKKRLKEIEEEAAALREMQAKVEKEMGAVQDSSGDTATQAEKEEVDSRSIYVGNVDYSCTPEEVQQHFQSCGTVNRITILTDKFGQPKGFAYVEFVEVESVQNALLLNESELHGRQLKISAKRTNVPGMKQYRGRRPNPYMGFQSRRPYMPPPYFSPYGYGHKSSWKEVAKAEERYLVVAKARSPDSGGQCATGHTTECAFLDGFASYVRKTFSCVHLGILIPFRQVVLFIDRRVTWSPYFRI